MTTRETILWLLIALLAGILLGLLIANRNRPQPDPTPRNAKTRPAKDSGRGGNISKLDTDELEAVG